MSAKTEKPGVGILMGSKSDLQVVEKASGVLKEFGVPYRMHVSSAHRTHSKTMSLVASLEKEGVEVFIACAGGAAHLPGVVAALTNLPVIGIPAGGTAFSGMDSLLSIVQMPKGMPVATVAVNGAANAALLAVQILSLKDGELRKKYAEYRDAMKDRIEKDDRSIQE